jgi:hypothetical protein
MTDRWHPAPVHARSQSGAGEGWHREATWVRPTPSRPRSGLPLGRGLRHVGRAAFGSTLVALGTLLLAGLASPAPLTFANASAGVVQSFGAANTTGSATLSKSPTAATTSGDLLVAVIRTRNTTVKAPVSSVTDPASNHWVMATSVTQGSQADQEIWYAANAAALTTAQSITVTVGGTAAASSAIAFTVLDITGATTSPLDVIAHNGGATQPASTGTTVATGQASEIAIGDIGWNSSTVTVSGQTSSYTVLPIQNASVSGDGAGEQGAWQLLSATGAQSYSATLSSSTVAWTGAIATFKLAGTSGPTITGFSPSSGAVGTIISITGSGFTGATAVKFNGITATTVSIKDDGHINATVPTGASSGLISVTASGTTAFSPTSFTLLSSEPAPTISGFSPPSGPVGTVVTISGTSFSGATVVKFNTTSATFTVTDDAHITATVPTGATNGSISVTAPGGPVASSGTFTVTTVPAAPHIMLIVEENHSYNGTNGVIGNANAPYINSLAGQYLSATNWYAPDHGSPLDYTSLLAGNTDGSITKPSSDTTLVDELASKGDTWGAYMEAMPFSCDTANWPTGSNSSTALYALDHNPFTYYTSTRTTAACQNNIPVGAPSTIPVQSSPPDPFATLMSGGSLPDFMFVVPDNCNEMHSECPSGGNNEPSNADAWLKYNLPAIQASSWYAQGGIVIITWDEAYNTDDSAWVNGGLCPSLATAPFCGGNPVTTGGHIPTIVISAANAASATHNYCAGGNLFGITRAIEEDYGVGLLSNTSNAGNGDLSPAFGATSSGCIGGTVTDGTATGHPVLAGVTVTCSCQTAPATTNAYGNYSFGNIAAGGPYTLTFNDNGYVTQVSSVSVTSGNTTTQNAALAEAGSIGGKVTDATTLAAVANATVTCTCLTGSAFSDSNGNYTLADVPPGSGYAVTFNATGYQTKTITGVSVTAKTVTTENAALSEQLGGITGTVTDSLTHAAISGASVTCTSTPTCTGATTATDGTYTISSLAPGTYHLIAAASGYTSSATTPVVVGTTTATQNFALVPHSGSISGTVTDSITGLPINGATVACSGSPTCISAITPTNGTYTLSSLTEGTYQLVASAPNYTTSSTTPVVVVPGGTPSQPFALVPTPGTITGTVIDTFTSLPVSGASVTCNGPPACTGTSTASDGSYTLTVEPGSYTVVLSKTGYITTTRSGVVVTSGNAASGPSSLAPSQGTISGTVIDSVTLAPVSGATVACSGSPSCTSVFTGTNGSYTLTSLNEGTYQVFVSATNYTPSSTTPVVVGPGGTPSQGFSLVPNLGTISGNVYESDGSTPIVGATVACTGALSCSQTTSGAGGGYSLTGLTEGSYQITASMTGFSSETLTVVVGPGGAPTQDFELIAGPGTITGTVLDTVSGLPVSGASVTCSGSPTCTGTTTVSDGSYTLTVAPGTYTVQLSDTGYAPTTQPNVMVTTGNQTAGPNTLTPSPGTISGTVTDSITHAPISGATVACSGPPACASAVTAGDGSYTLTGLNETTYQVFASATNYTTSTTTPVAVGPGGSPTQNFALAPLPGTIRGTVTASGGAGIIGATVACTGTLTCTSTLTSDSAGDYQLTGLTEGTYQITASKTGFTPETSPVVVGPGGTTTQGFQLTAAVASLGVAKSFGNAMPTTGSNTLTATLTSGSTGAGDLLVVVVRSRTASTFTPVSGITDSSGTNVWTAPPAGLKSQHVQADEEIWYLPSAASVTSVTVTMTGTTSVAMTVLDVTGTSATPLDKTSSTFNTTATATTGSTPLTTQANEIVIGAIAWNGAETAGFPNTFTSGFTTTGTGLQETSAVTGFIAGEQTAWEILSSTGTPSFSGTLSGPVAWTGVIATFH